MKSARSLQDIYPEKTRHWMRAFYQRLSEKDRRCYAALEAEKLGHGGITLVCELFGCCRDTVRQGIAELETPSLLPPEDRIRSPGGGRKGVLHEQERLEEELDAILQDTIAGDPMNPSVQWTHLNARQIQEALAERGIRLAENTVRGLLKKKELVKRKAQKRVALGSYEQRDDQFRHIVSLLEEYERAGNPAISVDTKKKEHLGSLYREGTLYVLEGQELVRWDHDFSWLSEGVIVPHGIYDFFNNTAYINIGTSKETSEFACDSVRRWWYFRGRYDWPQAESMLMLVDAGAAIRIAAIYSKKTCNDS